MYQKETCLNKSCTDENKTHLVILKNNFYASLTVKGNVGLDELSHFAMNTYGRVEV
jgi:hypothetical protein